jgi:hypothetical protein
MVNVPPTVKLEAPVPLRTKVDAEGEVVKFSVVAPPALRVLLVVVIPNERLALPPTVKASALVDETGAKTVSPVTEPAPNAETTTVPPAVPGTMLPNPSTAVEVCVKVIGATIVADAEPVAVAVSPGAAKAVPDESATMAAAKTSFFM